MVVEVVEEKLVACSQLGKRRTCQNHKKDTTPEKTKKLPSTTNKELKKAQTEVASLQWLAQKTRPDIACLVAIAASVQTMQPKEAHRLLL
eukprot:609501-Prorocentrum_lima.AAC.1